MKKLPFFFLILVASACSKKDAEPNYSNFTPVSGQFTVFQSGFFRVNHKDTTAVLSDLHLRIQPSLADHTVDVYEFKGNLSAHEVENIQFYVPHSSNGSGNWSRVQVYTTYYINGKSSASGNGPTAGTLTANGRTFTANFDVSGLRGTLK